MKLNTGDLCKILEKGKFEKIREMEDYWYKILFNGNTGWVFGSQTSAKLKKNNSAAENSSSNIKLENISGETVKAFTVLLYEYLKNIDESKSQDCQCAISSSFEIAFENNKFAFINVKVDLCGATCQYSNYSYLIQNKNNEWKIKSKFEAAFKARYQSGDKHKNIIVLENLVQYHLMEKRTTEIVYLMDDNSLDLLNLDLNSQSCEIIGAKNFGCDYCEDNVSHIEELIFVGDPVSAVQKKITQTKYDLDNECNILKTEIYTEDYEWVLKTKTFEKK